MIEEFKCLLEHSLTFLRESSFSLLSMLVSDTSCSSLSSSGIKLRGLTCRNFQVDGLDGNSNLNAFVTSSCVVHRKCEDRYFLSSQLTLNNYLQSISKTDLLIKPLHNSSHARAVF